MATNKQKASDTPKAPKGNGPRVAGPDGEDRKWRAQSDLDTLARAEEIRRDQDRMKEADRCRQEKMRDLASIKVEVAPMMKMKGK